MEPNLSSLTSVGDTIQNILSDLSFTEQVGVLTVSKWFNHTVNLIQHSEAIKLLGSKTALTIEEARIALGNLNYIHHLPTCFIKHLEYLIVDKMQVKSKNPQLYNEKYEVMIGSDIQSVIFKIERINFFIKFSILTELPEAGDSEQHFTFKKGNLVSFFNSGHINLNLQINEFNPLHKIEDFLIAPIDSEIFGLIKKDNEVTLLESIMMTNMFLKVASHSKNYKIDMNQDMTKFL